MNPSVATKNPTNHWKIVVDSIGSAGATLIPALKRISPLSPQEIAARLYRAPAELIRHLPQNTAEELNQLFEKAGLESRVVPESTPIEPGAGLFEIALVAKDPNKMSEAAHLIMKVLGVGFGAAKKILRSTPSILIAQVSEATVTALRKQFAAVDVEIDVSHPEAGIYDLFLGPCSQEVKLKIRQAVRMAGVPLPDWSPGENDSILASGLEKSVVDRLWKQFKQGDWPVLIVNRDFQRFDLQLNAFPDTPECHRFLMETTGMPEKVAKKISKKVPIVLAQNINFQELSQRIEAIHHLGGEASGQLLVFRTCELQIERVGDQEKSSHLLQVLADLDAKEALEALFETKHLPTPLPLSLARWLQAELEKVGTKVNLQIQN